MLARRQSGWLSLFFPSFFMLVPSCLVLSPPTFEFDLIMRWTDNSVSNIFSRGSADDHASLASPEFFMIRLMSILPRIFLPLSPYRDPKKPEIRRSDLPCFWGSRLLVISDGLSVTSSIFERFNLLANYFVASFFLGDGADWSRSVLSISR